MLRWIVGSSLKFRFLVIAIAAGMIYFGIGRLQNMPVDVFPEFAPPIVEIQTPCLGLSPAEVEALVTIPLEEALAGVPELQLPPPPDETDNVYWVYGVVLGDSHPCDAAQLQSRLREKGVATRPFFVGLHQQPALRRRGIGAGESYPVAERLSRRGLYLPSGLGLTQTQVATVAQAVRDCLSTAGRHIA